MMFKKGQKIISPSLGEGKIISIDQNSIYPIDVRYKNKNIYYTELGLQKELENRS
jgi:RNA polymerase-interacting CarD/CdnL/TRCF family regulator